MLNPKVERVIHTLERGWNSQVLETKPPPLTWRRTNLPDENLKRLIFQGKLPAMTESKSLPTRTFIDSNDADIPSAYNSITATLGFRHHKGTDKSAELKVLKFILKRESLLNLLMEICHPKEPNDLILQNRQKTGILDIMTQIRNVTVELIESICYWRTTMLNADPEVPRPFIYEDNNYLLKVTYDLNFLADITFLVENLGVDSTNMLRNPLMLPEPLDTDKLAKQPAEWAKKDTNDDINSEQYPERLKLRKAEQVILQEIEFNRFGGPSTSTVWNTYSINSSPSQQSNNQQPPPPLTRQSLSQGSLPLHLQNVVNRKKTLLEWYDVAKQQMHKLENAQSENLNIDMTSTKRLIIPSNKSEEVRTKYSTSPPRYVEPIKLYELTSDKVDEEYGAKIFQDPAVLHPGLSSPKNSRTKSRGSKVRKSKRLPNNNSPPRISDQEAIEVLIYDGMMKTHHPNLTITDTDVHVIGQITKPFKSLSLAGAATMIVLTENGEIPQNISWDFFRGFAVETPLAYNMNTLKPASIPQYKIRAMKPFLINLEQIHNDDLQNDPSLKENNPALLNSSTKFVRWIMEVMNFALNPPNLSLLNAAISSSTFQSVLNRRAAASAEKKKRIALTKVATPEDMKVIYEIDDNKLVENVYLHIQLLSLKKKPLVDQLQRFVIKVIDEKTYEFCEAPINQREMDQYSWEIRESFPDVEMKDIFQPTSANWWKKYMLNVIQVRYYNNEFSVKISKRLIKLQLLQIYEEKKNEIIESKAKNSDNSSTNQKNETKKKKSKEKIENKPSESIQDIEGNSNWSFHTEQNPETEIEIETINNESESNNNNNNNNDQNKNKREEEIPESEIETEPIEHNTPEIETKKEIPKENEIQIIKEEIINIEPEQKPQENKIEIFHEQTDPIIQEVNIKQEEKLKEDNSPIASPEKQVDAVEDQKNDFEIQQENHNNDSPNETLIGIIENKPIIEKTPNDNHSDDTEIIQEPTQEIKDDEIKTSPKESKVDSGTELLQKDDVSLPTPRSIDFPAELGFESDDQSFPPELGLYEVGEKIMANHQNLDTWFDGIIIEVNHKNIQNHEVILYDVRYADGEEEYGLTSNRIKRSILTENKVTESTHPTITSPHNEKSSVDIGNNYDDDEDLYNIQELRDELNNEKQVDQTISNNEKSNIEQKNSEEVKSLSPRFEQENVPNSTINNKKDENNENNSQENELYDILFDDEESDLKSLKESQDKKQAESDEKLDVNEPTEEENTNESKNRDHEDKGNTNSSLGGESNENYDDYDDEFEEPDSPVKTKRKIIEDTQPEQKDEKQEVEESKNIPSGQEIVSENESSTYNEYGESDFDQDDDSNLQNPSIVLNSEPEDQNNQNNKPLENNNLSQPTQSIISIDDTKTALLSDGDNNSLGYQDEEFDVDEGETNKQQQAEEQKQQNTKQEEEEEYEENYDDDFGDE